jgi:hypothetical protein
MIEDKEKMVLYLFLLSARHVSNSHFDKLKAFSSELTQSINSKSEFSDQLFAQAFSDFVRLIEALR